jgi:primosomal protein N'
MLIEAAIPLYVHQTFTYLVPARLAEFVQRMLVIVPFGRQLLTAYIVEIHSTAEVRGGTDRP